MGLFFVPVMATVNKWFGTRAGLANGIVVSGFGFSQMVLPPVACYYIVNYSWRTCFVILGWVALFLGITAWSFIKNPPIDIPESNRGKSDVSGGVSLDKGMLVDYDFTVSETLHTTTFWFLSVIYLIIAISYQMVIIHIIVAAMDRGITASAAALILSFSGIMNTLGRLTVGGLSDIIGKKVTLSITLVIQSLSLFFLSGASAVYVFYTISIVHGFAYAGSTPVVLAMIRSYFGTKSVGTILGILNLAYTSGVALGPLLGGYIFDVSGSYWVAFISAGTGLALSLLLCLFIKRPGRRALTEKKS